MTDEELTEIEQRCDRAAKGPWRSYVEGRDHHSGESFIWTETGDLYLIGASVADQDFIAAARQDVPTLIAEVRRLRAQRAA